MEEQNEYIETFITICAWNVITVYFSTALQNRADGSTVLTMRGIPMAKVNNILKTMTRKEIRQLSVAVFFLFATIGPLTLLMEPTVLPGPWYRLIILTFTSGLFSAGIILFIGKPVKLFLWIGLFVAFQFSYPMIEQRMFTDVEKRQMIVPDRLFKISKEEMDDVETKRPFFGMIAIICLSTGYALFVRVIGNEKKRRAESEAIDRDIVGVLRPFWTRSFFARSASARFQRTCAQCGTSRCPARQICAPYAHRADSRHSPTLANLARAHYFPCPCAICADEFHPPTKGAISNFRPCRNQARPF